MALLAACGGGGGASAPPPAPVARPGAPSGVVTSAGNGQVTISWGVVTGATAYNIYRSTTAGQQGSTVGTSTTLSFIDTRRVLGLSLAAALNAPIPATKFGVFRM